MGEERVFTYAEEEGITQATAATVKECESYFISTSRLLNSASLAAAS